jgi:hypothetical protein
MGRLNKVWRSALLGLGVVALMLVSPVSLTGCGKKEAETSAEGYYEGPMKPKSERGVSPTQGGGASQVGGQ